ncbi:alpha-ketoglutarate-dependent dioxygenase AlkB family protein [Paludisphaera mucosa]|uniref:Alpha-ketoglutarate-dependent dioxygenase AlkB n=1 Tax=Paludisphaera mucosa TaxID=3030827 RepID=A0ABT6FL82_9BACT|nr:alpha-ketoglutarate-dependent dioxygenase AlkB [Paludisphaera mucosa]MDG3008330.1 alpha-ketoglutarate-dependent dioxygenase AlkB [Paludisphaera mucosa]
MSESTTDSARPFLTLDLPEAEVVFHPSFFPTDAADRLLRQLVETTRWRQDSMKMFGELKPLPRLTAWYGDAGARYVYSGIVNEPLPWTTALAEVKHAVEAAVGVSFNGVLLNRYRDGRDGMGWHADDEPEFGEDPVIASVSFGGTRNFQLKHKRRKELKASVELTHGSLLVMRGGTQANWLHQISKTAKPVEERLNLTFRHLVTRAE